MSIYIQDEKTKTIRQYDTNSKVEKAIEVLLRQDENLVSSETHEGYEVSIVRRKDDT